MDGNWTAFANETRSNASAFGQPESDLLQEVVAIVVPILFAIIVIVGLLGNSLVIIVVKCNPTVSSTQTITCIFMYFQPVFLFQMYSTTNLLIINLAIADLVSFANDDCLFKC